MGRQLDVMSEDSVNPATASTKAQRMLEQDKVDVPDGRDQLRLGADHHAGRGAQQAPVPEIGARSDVLRGKNCNRYTFHVDIPGHRDGERRGPGAAARRPDQGQAHLQPDLGLPVRPRPGQGGEGVRHGQRRHASSATSSSPTDATDFSPLPAQDPAGEARPGRDQPRRQPGHQLRQAVCRVRPALPGRRLQPQHGGRLGGRRRQPERHLADGLAPRDRHPGLEGFRRGVPQEARPAAREPRLDRVRLASTSWRRR